MTPPIRQRLTRGPLLPEDETGALGLDHDIDF